MDCTGRMRHILPNLPIDRAANRLRHWARRWLPSLTVDPVLVCRRHAFAWGKGWQERLRKDVACLAALLIDGDHGGRDALLCEHGVDHADDGKLVFLAEMFERLKAPKQTGVGKRGGITGPVYRIDAGVRCWAALTGR